MEYGRGGLSFRCKKKNKYTWRRNAVCSEVINKPPCDDYICKDCHTCVRAWDDLSDDEKNLPLMNADIAIRVMRQRHRRERIKRCGVCGQFIKASDSFCESCEKAISIKNLVKVE